MLNSSLANSLRTTKRHLARLEDLGVKTIKDFLLYFPRTYNDSSQYTKIIDVSTVETNTIKGKLSSLFNIKTKYGKKSLEGFLMMTLVLLKLYGLINHT